ncbi:MAG: glutaredoxin family protein [Peptoniphilaceae bacterium]
MENLKLYVGTICPFCIKVENFIKENNIQGIEVVNVDKNPKEREFLVEKGGKRQVPCLFIGETPMYESNDIINYLKDEYVK